MSDNSFFSMDRLVEFGLGMAVAQQMTNAPLRAQSAHLAGRNSRTCSWGAAASAAP